MSTCQHDHIVRQHTRLRSAREMSFWTTSSRGVTPWGTSGTNPSTLSEWPRSRRVSSPPSPPPSPSYTCPSLETRVMETEWRIPRYLHSFFFLFILPLILFSDKYLLIFFYLILSYLQKKIWLKEIFHIFYSSKRIFYNEQWNSTDISLVFKSVSKYSCLVIIPPAGTSPSQGYFPSKSQAAEYTPPTPAPHYQTPSHQDSYGSPLAKPVSSYGVPTQKPPAPVGRPVYVSVWWTESDRGSKFSSLVINYSRLDQLFNWYTILILRTYISLISKKEMHMSCSPPVHPLWCGHIWPDCLEPKSLQTDWRAGGSPHSRLLLHTHRQVWRLDFLYQQSLQSTSRLLWQKLIPIDCKLHHENF